MASDDFFLGVERSVTGRRWLSRDHDERTALALTQRLDAPELIGRILAARGVGLDDVETFLDPSLRHLLPDPSHLKGMEAATERLARAVMQGEKVAVYGDYDVDGATSAALLTRYVRAVGGTAAIYIPDRIDEGYGPNVEAFLGLGREGASLIVTVDCGTTAFEPLKAAADAGIDVIVADHHEAEALLPPAIAVVNPNRLDEDSPHSHMAAVGVTFLLAVGLNRALREAGWFGAARAEPDMRQWLDLVALGTVCDVVPLVGVNRALVSRGLAVMAARGNAGLRALADIAGIDEAPGAYHAGYMLGPRINAGGRIGRADLGARLLVSDDEVETTEIAARLDAYNRERQDTELGVLNAALDQVEETGQAGQDAGLIFVAGEGWHPGVVGIVAGRLANRFNRPACVISINGDRATGSGRSIAGVDLGAAIIAARQSGLLLKGGGHVMAAGFAARSIDLKAFGEFLQTRLASEITVAAQARGLNLDGALSPGGATRDLVAAIEKVGPFGTKNPEPRVVLPDVRVSWSKVVGANHVSCSLSGADGSRLRGIAFRAMDSELGPALLNADGAPLHVAGKLRLNSWQGNETVQMFIDDAAPAW
ncbi:MAG: single-stranded-DNA-specific exonuclease RecJ [Alphaproteobacteria bacterium]|nr:single-stranded-DNA-specific exonuclease RecJ [Alphaproteobacteria bacterium]